MSDAKAIRSDAVYNAVMDALKNGASIIDIEQAIGRAVHEAISDFQLERRFGGLRWGI